VYRVLIVDDEDPVLESYSFMLRGAAGFELCGAARSGYEALEKIHETRPDVVFMDINIPGMDGLDVIAGARAKCPATVFILSTAYERFDLAQRAIPLGVFSYLLKPVSKKTFLETLEKAREALDDRADTDAAKGSGGGAFTQQFFRRALLGPLTPAAWERARKKLGLPSDKALIVALESAAADAAAEAAALAERLSRRYPCVYDAAPDASLFLLSGAVDRGALTQLLTELLRGSAGAVWGLGSLRSGVELHISRAEALENLRANRARASGGARKILAALRRAIKARDDGEAARLLARYSRETLDDASADFGLARARFAAAFTLLLDDAVSCYRDDDAEPPFDPVTEIMALETPAALAAWAEGGVNRLLDLQKRRGARPAPLEAALAYIDARYTETLRLEDAAGAAGVSAAYLSRLFTEFLRTSFVDYLTGLRVKHAERLLRDSNMSVKEVSYAAGFRDPAYFSKIFHKLTGRSPSQRQRAAWGTGSREYRQRHGRLVGRRGKFRRRHRHRHHHAGAGPGRPGQRRGHAAPVAREPAAGVRRGRD